MAGVSGVGFSPLNYASSNLNSSIQRSSTASKQPEASYGASEYAISQRMTSNVRAYDQSVQNTQNSNAMLKTAAGAIGNTVESLTTLRENILNAMNGTNTDADRATIQKSIGQTISQINENASVTYNGKRLIDGSNPSSAVVGSFGQDEVKFGNMTSGGLGLTDAEGNASVNVAGNKNSLADALDMVDKALSSALDQATTIGAQQQGLEYQETNYITAGENLTNAENQVNGLDMASEAVKFKSSKTQEELALFGIKAQMNMNREKVASLLG